MRRLVLILWGIAAGTGLLVVAARERGFLWVATASVPRGLWRATPGRLDHGAVVVLCPPNERRFQAAREAGYVPGGWCPGNLPPFVKPVAALPGDTVELSAEGVRVNGGPILANSRPLPSTNGTAALRPMPAGRYTVGADEVWLVSEYHPRSWDSRYYGPVPIRNVTAVAQPVWTIE